METIRRVALRGTELARAQCGTIRLKLLRIGATSSATRDEFGYCLSSHPNQELFFLVASRLKPG